MPTSNNPESVEDEAAQLLRLAGALHTARGNPAAWVAAIHACRDWFGCAEVFNFRGSDGLPTAADIEALAGRLCLDPCAPLDLNLPSSFV